MTVCAKDNTHKWVEKIWIKRQSMSILDLWIHPSCVKKKKTTDHSWDLSKILMLKDHPIEANSHASVHRYILMAGSYDMLVDKSRLQEKLGHHWGSGEVSAVWPSVLFHCLVRLVLCVCVFVCMCACMCVIQQAATWAAMGKLKAQEVER